MKTFIVKYCVYTFVCVLAFFSCVEGRGQAKKPADTTYVNSKDTTYSILVYSRPVIHDSNKIKKITPFFLPGVSSVLGGSYIVTIKKTIVSTRNLTRVDTIGLSDKETPASKPFITVHGNVLYDLNYRSNIDTPFAEKDIYQHTVQTYFDITLKDQYPLRFYFTSQFSNSYLFRKFTNVNFQFNESDFRDRIREKIKGKLLQTMNADSLQILKSIIERKIRELADLKSKINNPSVIQRMIEERERQVLEKAGIKEEIPGEIGLNGAVSKIKTLSSITNGIKDSLQSVLKDSAIVAKVNSFTEEYEKDKMLADSLQNKISELENSYTAGMQKLKRSTELLKRDIDQLRDARLLKEKMESAGVSDSLLPKGYKILWAIKSFGIGRSVINYSELSAKNVSITGLQVEYNPRYYFAFASGSVDYRFRDYIVRNNNQPKQYVSIVRAGKGSKDQSNIILTYYTGQRQLYNSSATPQGIQVPNYRLMGFTVEGQLRINKSNFLTAEVAKSSRPYYSLANNPDKSLRGTTFQFNDRTNEAYALKITSFLPGTQTRINGFYRLYGANFQSFSMFTSGSTQRSWSLRADQPFFKKRLTVMGSVRSNDFTNPFIDRAYNSSTVFKSIQATFRKRGWPVISTGYYPSSQLTKMSNDQFTENLFYTFNATVNHFYKLKKNMVNTSIVYTQFYNKASDSNFVYYNTRNLLVSQSVFLNKFTYQCNLSGALNTEYALYTLENTLQYRISNSVSLGGGVKYNKQTVFNRELMGYSGSANFKIPKLGEFQFMMDKGFIPGMDRELVENNVGRFTYYKVF